jgi:hypothetical protein
MNHAFIFDPDQNVLKIGEKGQNTWKRCHENSGQWLDFRVINRRELEGRGEELIQGQDLIVALQVGHDDLTSRAELRKYLTAEAAGGDWLGGVGDHGQGFELALAGGHGGKDGHPLGAHGGPEGGVLDVATGEDPAVGGEDGGAHRKRGIGGVGRVSGLPGGG